jgi:hypothetical protein
MIPLCLIGNSHLAAIRNGWKDGEPHTAPFKASFFATRNGAFSDLVVDGDRLVAGSEDLAEQMRNFCGGRTEIRVRDYSAFLLVALQVHIGYVHGIYAHHRLAGHATPNTQLISRAALRAAIRDRFRKSAALRTVRKIRQISPSAPIAFIPEPLLSQNVLKHKGLGTFWRGEQAEELAKIYWEAVTQFAAELDIFPIFQPPETIAPPAFTNVKYSQGVVIWVEAEKSYDHRHMNAAFGERMLECALPKLLAHLAPQKIPA